MSKKRYVNDSFWTDPYIEKLDPIEKLCFLYLLTNPLCNIAGVYEIRTKRFAFEVGLDMEVVENILNRFIRDNKILKDKDWIIIINHKKNQSLNPSVEEGIIRIINSIPEEIKSLYFSKGKELKENILSKVKLSRVELSRVEQTGDSLGSDSNKKDEIAEIIKAMCEIDPINKRYYGNTTQREACKFLIEEYQFEQVIKMIDWIKNNFTKIFNPPTSPQQLMNSWTRIIQGEYYKKQSKNKIEVI